MEYILATRIVLAKEMLQKTDLTVGEISERCGFSSISYFCRVFKQDTGRTPLGFRKSGG
jgi:AraC-like DNA-binding protein